MIENDRDSLTKALETISAKLNIHTSSHDMVLYLKLFKKRLIEKQSDESELWLNDIESIAKMVKSEVSNIEHSMTLI